MKSGKEFVRDVSVILRNDTEILEINVTLTFRSEAIMRNCRWPFAICWHY